MVLLDVAILIYLTLLALLAAGLTHQVIWVCDTLVDLVLDIWGNETEDDLTGCSCHCPCCAEGVTNTGE